MVISPKKLNVFSVSTANHKYFNNETIQRLETYKNSVSSHRFGPLAYSLVYSRSSLIDNFTRARIREDYFYRRVMPQILNK